MIIIDNTLLILLVILSIRFDVTERRVPNFLTFPIILWGIVSSGVISGFSGILFSLSGFLVGMAVFFIPFALNGMGAGDVKLMAAIGSLMGWQFVLVAALASAIVGGVISLGVILVHGGVLNTIRNIRYVLLAPIILLVAKVTNSVNILHFYHKYKNNYSDGEKIYIPYALAIGIGTIIILLGNQKGVIPFFNR